MSGRQLAAARVLLGMSQAELALQASISVPTLKRMEGSAGEVVGMPNNIAAVRRALEAAGVEFIPENGGGAGVRLRKAPETVQGLTNQIDALADKVSNMPEAGRPSPEDGMNTMRKAVAENDLTKLRNRRSRIKKHDT
jgi:transcriptional regulator with XRE-family HTH domain